MERSGRARELNKGEKWGGNDTGKEVHGKEG